MTDDDWADYSYTPNAWGVLKLMNDVSNGSPFLNALIRHLRHTLEEHTPAEHVEGVCTACTDLAHGYEQSWPCDVVAGVDTVCFGWLMERVLADPNVMRGAKPEALPPALVTAARNVLGIKDTTPRKAGLFELQ